MTQPIVWTVKDVPPQPSEPEREYRATVERLEVMVKERHVAGLGIATAWTVIGYLVDIRIYAHPATNSLGYGVTVEQAQEQAIAAAHRLYAAGVRGERTGEEGGA